ncbi:Protein fantom [Phlyctochytrium planicorne]|nr:Protein fantom [Phlyctochytrium planicorne]
MLRMVLRISEELMEKEEALSMIEELKAQVRDLTKQNNQIKAKAELFRSLHEAESRKKAPYDHIGPRITTGLQKRKLNAGLIGKAVASQTIEHLDGDQIRSGNMIGREEYEKLEEVVNMLRTRLQEQEHSISTYQWKLSQSEERLNNERKQRESEIVALQVQASDFKILEENLRNTVLKLESENESLHQSYKESASMLDAINNELKDERRKNIDLEHSAKETDGLRDEIHELSQLVHDLKSEKRMLEEEQENLLRAQFSREREMELLDEIDDLRKKLSENNRGLADELDNKASIHSELERYRRLCSTLEEEKKEAYDFSCSLKEELEILKEKLSIFEVNGELDLSEIEEAIALVKLQRQKGISFEFLTELADNNERHVIQELRIQNAECIQELEKTRKLLTLQEHINKDYKLEVEELNRKIESLKNGYELRLEEDARLLDLRSSKIAQLESQLKNIVYGTAKGGKLDDDTMAMEIDLLNGQNMVEIHIESVMLSDAGLDYLRELGLFSGRSNITLFVFFEFFDFETVVTPIGTSVHSTFNHTSRFRIFTDDFFLQYLQTQRLFANICISNGLDYICIGSSMMSIKELTDPMRTAPIRFYADVLSSYDNRTLLGKLDYSLRAHLPMSQAIRAFKERTLALNLLDGSFAERPSRTQKFPSNELIINISRVSNLGSVIKGSSIFVGFQLYVFEEIATHSVKATSNPLFNYTRRLPMPMTHDVDNFLRNGMLFVVVMDDSSETVYGSCQIPVYPLASDERIAGEFDLFYNNQKSRGSIVLSMEWSRPYSVASTKQKPIPSRQSSELTSERESGSEILHQHSTASESVTASSVISEETPSSTSDR